MTSLRLHMIATLLGLSAAAALAGGTAGNITIRATVLHREPIVKNQRRPWRVVPWTLESRLGRDDFEVSCDNVPCVVDSAAPTGATLSLTLLLDASSSSQVRFDHVLTAVRKVVVPALRPSDRVSIVRIGGKDGVVTTPFNTTAEDVMKAAEAALSPSVRHALPVNLGFGYGPSPIWDAVDGAVTRLGGEPPTRGIIVLTDGRATGNRMGVDEVVGRAVAAGVPVHVVGAVVARVLRQDAVTAARVRPKVFIESMADATGGVYIDLFATEPFSPAGQNVSARTTSANNAAAAMVGTVPLLQWPQDEQTIVHWVGRSIVHAIEALRASYVVQLSCPTSRPGPHPLNVRVKRPGLEVRAPRAMVN